MKTYQINKKQMEINRSKTPSSYEIYSSYFDSLDMKLFKILEYKGLLGRLFRGQRIDLNDEKIHIPESWWRYEIFKNTNQYVPCIVKSKNPYWAADNI